MEKKYRVLIIGAGLAGLACGKHLIESHIDDFLIVEANEQIGGRCQTIQFCDHPIELGGEILYGQSPNNALYHLAEQNHFIERFNRADRDDCHHDEAGQSIDEDIVDEIEQIYRKILEKKILTYPYENYPDVSLGEFINRELSEYLQMNKSSMDDEELNQRETVIDWFSKQQPLLSSIGCEKLTDVSVQGWNSFERLATEEGCAYLKNGVSNLLQTSFVSEITMNRIQLNAIVRGIQLHEDQGCVTVEILRKNREVQICQARHVVCTQSIGCLKKTMHELFDPPLPSAKQMSIEKLGFGTINKIYLIFSKPFWDADYNAFHFLWNRNSKWKLHCLEHTLYDSQWCQSITGFDVHHHLPNTLVTQVSGQAAKYIEMIPNELLSNCFREIFCRFYPDNQIPKPSQLIKSQWSSKSFIFGSHTFIPLGSTVHDIKQLAAPWPDQPSRPLVLFAGEGTHERFYGTMHGAFLTGIREAKRVVELYK